MVTTIGGCCLLTRLLDAAVAAAATAIADAANAAYAAASQLAAIYCWCKLASDRIYFFVNSHTSGRSINGR